MQHAGREQQALVIGGVAQRAVLGREQAGEQESADAVVGDRRALRFVHDGQARLGHWTCRQREEFVHDGTLRTDADDQQWPEGHAPL